MSIYSTLVRYQISNREIAVAIWSLLFFAVMLRVPTVRRSLLEIIRVFSQRIVAIVILLMILYICGIVFLLNNVGVWNLSTNLKDTIVWMVTVALVMVINSSSASKKQDYFRNTIVGTLKITVALEFLVSLYPFSLVSELLLIPVLAALGMMLAVSESNQGLKLFVKPLRWVFAVIGTVLIWHTVVSLLANWDTLKASELIVGLVLPAILTILFLPFIYCLALYSTYETLFVRVRIWNSDPYLVGLTKRAALSYFGVNLRKLQRWVKQNPNLKVHNEADVIRLFANGPKLTNQ